MISHIASFGKATILSVLMLMKRAGMQNLSNIVRLRRLTLAGHILRLCSGYLMEAREEEDVLVTYIPGRFT